MLQKIILYVLLGVQTFHFFNYATMQKSYKNSEILKNDGHFRIPDPQTSLK